MRKIEKFIGFIIIFVVLILSKFYFRDLTLFFRLMIGTGIGYSLARAYTGFAGSVNRAYRTGSTKLMRTMLFMFFITAVINAGLFLETGATNYNIWIKPINMGLIAGGFLFGFGMSLSVCCASGVLTDLPSGFPRAFVTLIFFGIGVFFGFPIQRTASWVSNSWFTTAVGEKTMGGVFLPDLFKGDGLHGYLGAILLIAALGAIISYFSYLYEKKQIRNNKFVGHPIEKEQEEKESFDISTFKLFSSETYKEFFVKPWTLKQGAVAITILFTLLMGVTKAGWGASQPYGIWFGKLLMFFGISSEAIANFTHMPAGLFELPFFEHQISVQNFGIITGAIIYLLTAGKFTNAFKAGLNMRGKEAAIYALGGITMGFGTRLANGCNVGALYTPISNLSLSGWFFLIAMIVGGIISNKFSDRVFN